MSSLFISFYFFHNKFSRYPCLWWKAEELWAEAPVDEASKAAGAEEETCEMSFERFFREI